MSSSAEKGEARLADIRESLTDYAPTYRGTIVFVPGVAELAQQIGRTTGIFYGHNRDFPAMLQAATGLNVYKPKGNLALTQSEGDWNTYPADLWVPDQDPGETPSTPGDRVTEIVCAAEGLSTEDLGRLIGDLVTQLAQRKA